MNLYPKPDSPLVDRFQENLGLCAIEWLSTLADPAFMSFCIKTGISVIARLPATNNEALIPYVKVDVCVSIGDDDRVHYSDLVVIVTDQQGFVPHNSLSNVSWVVIDRLMQKASACWLIEQGKYTNPTLNKL